MTKPGTNFTQANPLLRKVLTHCVVLLLTVMPFAHAEDPVDGAMEALDAWLSAFNSRQMNQWAAMNHYPHVRYPSGAVTVYENAEEFAARDVFANLGGSGWDHSHWIKRDVTLSSPNKVHVSTVFQRFNKDNQSIGKYQSLYILTLEEGRWGVKARSSLAP